MTNPTYNPNPTLLRDIEMKHEYFSDALMSLETIVDETNYTENSFVIVEQRRYKKYRFIIVRSDALDPYGYSYTHSGLYNTWKLGEARQEGAFHWQV